MKLRLYIANRQTNSTTAAQHAHTHHTCHRFDNHVGYKGQRFQAVGDKPDGTILPLGWTNTNNLKPWKFLAEHFGLENLRTELVDTEELR